MNLMTRKLFCLSLSLRLYILRNQIPVFETEAPYFEFCANRYGVMSNLIVYTTQEKAEYYKYHLVNEKEKIYRCYGCTKAHKRVTACLVKDKDGNEKLIMSNVDHICQPYSSYLDE